jgi:hypothetical protein
MDLGRNIRDLRSEASGLVILIVRTRNVTLKETRVWWTVAIAECPWQVIVRPFYSVCIMKKNSSFD